MGSMDTKKRAQSVKVFDYDETIEFLMNWEIKNPLSVLELSIDDDRISLKLFDEIYALAKKTMQEYKYDKQGMLTYCNYATVYWYLEGSQKILIELNNDDFKGVTHTYPEVFALLNKMSRYAFEGAWHLLLVNRLIGAKKLTLKSDAINEIGKAVSFMTENMKTATRTVEIYEKYGWIKQKNSNDCRHSGIGKKQL